MNSPILIGKDLAIHKQQVLAQDIAKFNLNTPPHLVVMIVGNDPASQLYVKTKQKRCAAVGILSTQLTFNNDVPQETLLASIQKHNDDPSTHGILVQLPLPKHIDTQAVIEAIVPSKDVDGFHPFNLGRLAQNSPLLRPCTPYGIMQLLQHYAIPIQGQHAVVLGKSTIVGLPMSLELLAAKATISICHRHTHDIMQYTRQADILITATGQPQMIRADHIKKGTIVIDVGITRLENGSIVGDVHFDSVKNKAGGITPVPGGVGPMTVTALLQNTWQAYISQQSQLCPKNQTHYSDLDGQ